MRILLANDDGIQAEGLRTLASVLSKEHEVYIAAPDTERSAVSRSMTLYAPLRATPTTLHGLENVKAYAVSGTPVDCVRLALGNLFPQPDVVISGINRGPNLGTDVLYSGTVGAAHEAALQGCRAAAISTCSFTPAHYETAARMALRVADFLCNSPVRFGTVLNVNVPDLPMESIRGVRMARTGIAAYALEYIERTDPVGRPYYWMPRQRSVAEEAGVTDETLVREGFVALTPLTYDLTDYRCMETMNIEGF